MSFIEKFWSKKKEIATTAAVSTILATGAAAEGAKHEAKPVEKTEQNIVSETGMPSQEINLQKNLNEMAEKDTTVKKLEDLVGPDSTFINKALANKWMNNFDNDEARVARLFSIFYEMKADHEKKINNAASKPKDEAGDEEETITRRKRSTGVGQKTDEELFSKAQDELYARETNDANEKNKTPEEKKQEEAASKQADIETAKETSDINKENAIKQLPDKLYDCLYSSTYEKILKGKYQGDELAIKISEYGIDLDKVINEVGAKIKAKGKVTIAEAGDIIKKAAGQKNIVINQNGIATAVDNMAAAGFIDGYTGSSK